MLNSTPRKAIIHVYFQVQFVLLFSQIVLAIIQIVWLLSSCSKLTVNTTAYVCLSLLLIFLWFELNGVMAFIVHLKNNSHPVWNDGAVGFLWKGLPNRKKSNKKNNIMRSDMRSVVVVDPFVRSLEFIPAFCVLLTRGHYVVRQTYRCFGDSCIRTSEGRCTVVAGSYRRCGTALRFI